MRVVLATLFALCVVPASQAATIAPHRAIYDLSLLRVSEGAGLTSAEGRLAFEVQGSTCEGWTVNFRMANRFAPSDGDVKVVDTQSTSFESADSLEMHYNQKEFVNGKLHEDSRVTVKRPTLGAEGSGEQGSATLKPFKIPSDTMFPTQHQLHLMDLAVAGQTRDSTVIFDGADGEKLYRAISFIGGRKAPGQNARDAANAEVKSLAGLASWPISVSYYPVGGAEDTPEYQVSFDLYENGVATGLVMDYGQFALTGKLTRFEELKSDPCDPGSP